MQKHYNERYMQTEKFPHASFRGTINQWEIPEKDGVIQVTATGEFTVHGVSKKRQLKGSVTKNGNNYLLKAEFETRLEDHNIEIPVLFFTRITEAVKVTVLYSLTVSDANDQR